jgi:branched-chain amino acid transport system substrate-binding protein
MFFGNKIVGILLLLILASIISAIIFHETPREHVEKRIQNAIEYEDQINELFTHNRDSLETITEINPELEAITIAIVWPISTTYNRYIEGVKLAAKEINENGGIFGRPLRLKFYDTKSDLDVARKLALKISNDEDIIAVVGHFYSFIAQITAFIYSDNGLLFITPGCQSQLYSLHSIDTFFRTIPNTAQMAEKAALYTQQLNYRNPVIITEDDIFAQKFSKLYQSELTKYGIGVVYDFTLLSWRDNYKMIVNQLKLFDYDLVVLAVGQESSTHMLREAKQMGINEEFLTINLDGYSITSNAQYDSLVIYNLAMFSFEHAQEDLTYFMNDYYETFEDSLKREYALLGEKIDVSEKAFIRPDSYTAYGYDAVMLLAEAIKKSRSIHPLTLATYLQFNDAYDGITGSNLFDEDGNVYLKPMYMKKIEQGRSELLTIAPTDLHSFIPKLKQELMHEIENNDIIMYPDSSEVLLLIEDNMVFNYGTSDIDSTGREILKKIAYAAQANDSIFIQIKGISKDETSAYSLTHSSAIAEMETSIKASRITSFLIRYGIKHDQIYTANSTIGFNEIFPKYDYLDTFTDEHIEILIVEKSSVKRNVR